MARTPLDHLSDVLVSIGRIREYTRSGEREFRRNAMARDAVIARLIQIGQAVKDAGDEGLDLPALAPAIRWRAIAGMRDRLVHKYWEADASIVWGVVARDLDGLETAVKSILGGKRRGRS